MGPHPVSLRMNDFNGLRSRRQELWYQEDLGEPSVTDPFGPTTVSNRVIRGGSYFHFASQVRAAYRSTSYWAQPGSGYFDVGFRPVKSL